MSVFFTWSQISDLKHICIEAAEKCEKLGLDKQKKYFYGVVDMIQRLIEEHENDSNDSA